jgi:hypothetical protein
MFPFFCELRGPDARRGDPVQGQPLFCDLGWIRAYCCGICPANRRNTTLLQTFSGITTRFHFNILLLR